MSLTMTCKHCDSTLEAQDEDELVATVQAHALTHERPVELTREHILARLHHQHDD